MSWLSLASLREYLYSTASADATTPLPAADKAAPTPVQAASGALALYHPEWNEQSIALVTRLQEEGQTRLPKELIQLIVQYLSPNMSIKELTLKAICVDFIADDVIRADVHDTTFSWGRMLTALPSLDDCQISFRLEEYPADFLQRLFAKTLRTYFPRIAQFPTPGSTLIAHFRQNYTHNADCNETTMNQRAWLQKKYQERTPIYSFTLETFQTKLTKEIHLRRFCNNAGKVKVPREAQYLWIAASRKPPETNPHYLDYVPPVATAGAASAASVPQAAAAPAKGRRLLPLAEILSRIALKETKSH